MRINTLSLLTVCSLSTAHAQKQPNIVFFFVDDMGWEETSLPFHTERTALNNLFHTPNMELLANDAVKFTQAYACPLSSPTRVSLMTGQNAARHKVTNWTLFKDKSPDEGVGNKEVSIPDWNVNGMSMQQGIENALYAEETLTSILKEAGYKTIIIGKSHLGAISTPGEDPINLGFDINIAGSAIGGPGSFYGTNNFSAKFRNGGAEWDVPHLEKYHGKDINLTEVLTLEALSVLEKEAKSQQPFYLYLSHYAVHAPWEADDRFVEKYKNMGLSQQQITYASMVESMDKSLGDVMHQLKRLGIYDDTIILFMSDNGPISQGFISGTTLRGHKISPYEGGIRVPLLVKANNNKSANKTSTTPIIIEDLFPTILEMASADSFVKQNELIDGKSFAAFVDNPSKKAKSRALFWHYPHVYYFKPYSVIRKGDWKLIWYYHSQEAELFNLKNDLGETTNLYDKESKIASELRVELRDHLKNMNATIPISTKTGKPFGMP